MTDAEQVRNHLAAMVFARDPQNGKVLQRLHRYEQAALRAWDRTLEELRRLRDEQARNRRVQAEVHTMLNVLMLNVLKSSEIRVLDEPSRREAIDLSTCFGIPNQPVLFPIWLIPKSSRR